MKKMMLVGRTDSGKTTLAEIMKQGYSSSRKTQSIEQVGTIIDTPGEFVENRRLYRALIVTSYDSDVVALVMDVDENHTVFPPNFASVFNREVIGIVTKIDKEVSTEYAVSCLKKAGASRIFVTSALFDIGLDELKSFIQCKEETS